MYMLVFEIYTLEIYTLSNPFIDKDLQYVMPFPARNLPFH